MERDIRVVLEFGERFSSRPYLVRVEITGSDADQWTRKVHDLLAGLESPVEINPTLFTDTGIPVTRVSQNMGRGLEVMIEIEAPGQDIPEDMVDVITAPRRR
jgi:hypothetical protein